MCEAAIHQTGIKKVYFGAYSQSLDIFKNKKKKFEKETKRSFILRWHK